MRRREFIAYSALGAVSTCLMTPALAQLKVLVTGIGATQIPVTILTLAGEQQSGVPIAEIVRSDLRRCGMFSIISVDTAMNEKSSVNYAEWKNLGTDALLAGSILSLANGKYEVKVNLWDIATARQAATRTYTVEKSNLRLVAHSIADLILEQFTGFKGAFASRIAYVTQSGSRHALMIADSDGEQAQSAFRSNEPIISPAWAPNGKEIAYVSFDQKKPVIYVQDIFSGQRRVVANYKGSNSAPAWPPMGGSMAAALTLSGLSQIYLIDGHGNTPKRLTNTYGIDTQPVFSPDGKRIYFVSDRGGNPQIYQMPASGGSAERVTFNASYCVDPALSPDGKWLAFIARDEGKFRLQVMNLQSGDVQALTDTAVDSKPSFAPNSMMIMYATRINGQDALMTTTLDGRVKTQLTSAGASMKEPVWGPYIS